MRISIIIPIYNVEQYIISCLRSVVCEAVSGERLAVSEESLRSGEGGASRGLTLTANRSSANPAEGTHHPSPITLHPFTDKAIELILVDDCGSDRSIAFAEEYLRGIPGLNYRILHHTHNRGLSAARNTGLAAAQGEYVYFLDSDDEMLPGALETLLQPLKDVKYDLVVGDYVEGETVSGESLRSGDGKRVKGEGEDLRPGEEEASLTANRSPLTVSSPEASMLRLPTGPVMGNEKILKGYATGKWYVMAWNKLCNRDFLLKNNLFFEEGLLHEDVVWTFKVACLAKSMYVAKVPTYFYRTREASIMTGMSIEKDLSIYVKAFDVISEFIKNGQRSAGMWEYSIFQGKRAGILYSLLQKGETGLYKKYYPDFYRQCYVSPWRAYRKGIIGLGYLVRDLHYLMPVCFGKGYMRLFYTLLYRMRNKKIDGAVWN